jgi:hypothetical protein
MVREQRGMLLEGAPPVVEKQFGTASCAGHAAPTWRAIVAHLLPITPSADNRGVRTETVGGVKDGEGFPLDFPDPPGNPTCRRSGVGAL